MFDIISTGKNTQWHTFPQLQTKCMYSHIANEAVDFQVVPGRNCFLEINKKSGFELLRTVHKNDTDTIQRLKKRQLEDLQCGAISKMYGSELAMGMSSGFIRIFSIQSGEFMPFKFKPDKIGNSVLGLDYSNCDEYLAALYDSTDVNLFGLKTGVKTDVFRFDRATTLIRFHPAKRFALAAASYQGAITLLDIQTKQKLFFDKSAHDSPARDITMCISSPDIFMSCGYDCNINVYDLRKRTMVQQCKQQHPMSTVCISECGTFCVAGNLKGDIISFDFRKLKEPFDTKRVHEGGVVRVAFVPTAAETNATLDQYGESINVTTKTVDLATSLQPPIQRKETIDSFSKFVDIYHHNNEVANRDSIAKRDSWLELGMLKNQHDFSMDSVAGGSPTRLSVGGNPGDYSELRLKRLSRLSLNQSMLSDIVPIGKRDNLLEIHIACINEEDTPEKPLAIPKRSRLTETPTSSADPEDHSDFKETQNAKNSNWQEKENRQNNNQQDIESFEKFIKDSHVSTPNHLPIKINNNEFNNENSVAVSNTGLRKMLSEIVEEKVDAIQSNLTAQMHSMETEIKKRIFVAENEIKFYQDHYHHSGFKGSFNLFKLMEREIDVLKEGMAIMLRDDLIAQDYYRLQEENEALKRELEKRSSK